MLLHILDLTMQQQRRDTEGEAENGRTAERDRHAYHALAADGFEYEPAQDAVHEVEQADNVLRRGEVPPTGIEDRGVEASSATRKAASPITHPQITQRRR